MKKISLIILNWNGWKMTLDCLESLRDIKCGDFEVEIVVVDNGSTDNSVESIKNQISLASQSEAGRAKTKIINEKLKIIENEKNLGFAEGNNVGIKYALENRADYVCLLNNDTRVDKNFLRELFKSAESDEKIGLVGGKIYFEKGYEFHKNRYLEKDLGKVIWYAGGLIDWNNVYASHRGVDEVDRGQYDSETETAYINGCLMLVKKEVFNKVGLFDKKYFLYFEDADFSVRAKKAGFTLYFNPRAKIWHLISGSSAIGSDLNDYFITRNRMLFGMKYAPVKSKLSLIKESIGLMMNGRRWQKTGIKDFYLNKFGEGSWKTS